MDARTSYDASGLGDDEEEYGGRRRRAAAKSFKAGYDDEIDFGDGSGDEEEEEDDDDDDDDDDAGRKRRKRRRRKGAAAKLAAASTVVTDDDDGPIVDEILFRRWVIPELEALAEVRARASEDRLWQEEDRMDARRLIARLTSNQEQLRGDAAKLEAAAGPSGGPHGEAQARHEAYQAALAAHESQAAVLQSARAQAEQALGQLDAQHRDAMQSYMTSLAAKGYPVEHQQLYGGQYQQRMQQTRAQLLGQWQARLEQIVATVPPHPGPPPSESRGTQLLSQARGYLETCDQLQGRINTIRAAAAAHGLDLDHRTRAPAAVSAAASAGAAAGPAAAVAAVAAITDGSDFDPLSGVPEEERAEGGRVPSYAEAHWSYLVKLRGRAFIHSRWLPETEVEEDNPPYSRSSLNRWIKRCRDEAAVRGLEQWAGDVQPAWDTKTYPRAEDASEALCSWSLEDIVDPAKYEVSKVLAAAPCDGAPAPGSPADAVERHAWTRQLLRVIDHLERFRISGVRASGPFMMPVDPERDGAPGYFDVVQRPMDLGTIRARLECVPPPGRAAPSPPYANPEQVASDIELVWSNCRAFSPDETHDIRILCDSLDAEWQRLWRRLRRRVALRGGRWMYLYDEGGVSRKFLVKWKGRSYSKCTWEHEEDIDDDEAVARYLEINRVPDSRSRPMPRQYPGGAPPTAVYTTSLDYKGRQLRSYQLEGLNWLIYAWRNSRNCILADEMGLGKTAQTVAFMHHLYHGEHDRGPYLVVVPLTTIPHWQREFAAWTDFRVCTYHDSEGGRDTREFIKTYEWFYYTRDASGQVMRFRDQFKFDVLLTTYEVSIADVEDLREVPWSLLAVDEGQRLKNKENKLMKALESLRVDRRLLLTGTPLQNNVSELWALLNFIEPEHFGSHPAFMAEFGDLRTTAQVERLTEVMRPHVLRRRKEDVEKSIPRKEETVVDVELTMMQKQYYRALFERNRAFLTRASAGSSSGTKQSAPGLLNLETELRKCCNHPFLIAGVEDRETAMLGRQDERMRMLVSASGKLVLLDKLLPKLRAEGHKVLIFSQMTKMLDILQAYCKWRSFPTERIDGSIRGNARQVAIDRFSDPESNSFVFLLSTRAGGVGITLTAADTVIIFDSDWNPQNDVQAQARAHRIGQTKSVKIYRLVTRRTYEATMFERASRKLGLEQAVMAGAGWDPTALGRKRDGPSKTEIERLLREGAYGALTDDEEAAAQASRAFEESDIDALLARGSRVVTIDPSGARGAAGGDGDDGGSGAAAEAASGESLHARGLLNFSKTTFAPGAQNQSVVNVDDPEFWSKVLGADARSTLLERLNKGEVTGTPQEREAFMQEVGAAGQEVIEAKLAGKAVPDWAPQLEAALVGISDPVGAFSEDQRSRATALLDQVERPTRRRRATAAAGAGVFAAASANELEAALGGDDEGEAYSVKGASSSSSKNRRRGRVDAETGDGASKKRVHKLVERGADAGRRQAGSVGCTLNVPLCAVTLREGQDLSLCRGACLRFLSSEASLAGPSAVVGTSMRCGECESGWQRCFGCGVAGPIGVSGAPAWLDALSHPITRAIADRAKRVWLKLAGKSEDEIAAALESAAADREKETPTPAKGAAAAAAAKAASGGSPSAATDGAAGDDAAVAATPKPGSAAGRRIGVPDDEQRESVFQAALASADAERPVGGAPLPWIPEGADESRGPRDGEPPTPMQLATMVDADFIIASANALKSPAIARETGLPVHPWSSRPVWPCAAARCGRYYCAGCVRVIPLFGMLAGTDPHRFRCPLHACTSCTRGADAFPLLQSLVSAHGCHIRCLPGSTDPSFPIRVSRRFVVPALHPRAVRAAALARGRIRVHNAGNKVAGELEDKESLAGQAGTGKATRKGPVGTVHAMCGPHANQPPRGSRAKRARKRPAKPADGATGKSRPKAGDTPASDAGSESADPSAKRMRPAEDDDDEDDDGDDVDDDEDEDDDDGDDVDGGDDVDDDGDDVGDDDDADQGAAGAAAHSHGAVQPMQGGEAWQGTEDRHGAGEAAPAGPVGIIPLRR